MLKVSGCALILCTTGFAVVSAEPVVNLEISAGAVIQTDSPVKFASLGEPIVGSGSGGFAGAGFSYTINLFKFSGTPRSATAILWNWIKIPRAGSYQVFNSAGNPVSDILPTGAVSFLQTNAAPDSVVSGFVRAYNDTGYIDSPPFTVTTLPKNPRMLELFSNQQVADFVVGSDQVGTEANRLKAPENIRYDRFGNLWVADTYNSRVLRFSPPFTTDKSADIVIGQPDFTSGSGATGPTRLKNSSALAFDAQDNLWVSDTGNNRILKFSFPFPQTNAAADYVIGQINFTNNNSGPGGSPNSLSSPQGIAFDSAGALWVVDAGRHRVLRFDNNFPVNPSASLVLGQPDLWTGSLTGVQANTLPYPENMTFDRDGNLWVMDAGNDRLLRFDAPLHTNMSATLVIGKNDLNSQTPPNADLARFNPHPRGVSFDPHGNLYVSDNRLLKFNPPFSNGMSASVVVGAGGEDVLAFTHKDSEPIPILWVVSGSKISGYKPNQSAFSDITLTSMKVSWQSLPGFLLTNYLVELSPKPDFSDLKASPWIQDLSYTFSGLIYGTAYYARVKMKYPDGTESEYLNLGKQSTLPPITVTGVTNGITEVQFSAVNPLINISPLYPNWDTGVVALRSAVDMGLTQISSVFVIGPDGAYVPPATLTFYYTESQIGWYGLTKDDIAVYEFFWATGLWVELPDKVIDPINHSITVPVHNVASLFGIFGKVRDRQAPVTKLNLTGSAYQTGEVTYISGRSSITLSAYDPVAYGTSTGVAFTEYRVDAATATSPFTSYISPFTLSAGRRLIEFRSQDHAGNSEVIKSSTVYVDTSAPITGVALSGTLGRNGWYSSGVTSVLASTDAFSGISETLYALNGAAFVNYQQPISIFQDGNHRLDYYSSDKVSNTELVKISTFSIDRTAPQVGFTLNPQPNSYGWNNASVEAVFEGTDTLSGMDICTSSRTAVEGAGKTLSGWCRDIAGNIGYSTAIVKIDISSPVVTVMAGPAANSYNWNNTPVAVSFSGFDAISGNFSCTADKTVSSEGAGQIVTGSCGDYAGNSQTAFRAVNIDMTKPATTVGLSGSLVNGWYTTAVSLTLVSSDMLSGVNVTNYRLERSGVLVSSGVYATPVAVISDGLYNTYYYATDKAGNAEAEKSTSFKIDRTLPQVGYTLNPAANGSTWNNTAVQVVFSGTDTLSGIVECSSQTVSVAGLAQTVVGWCRDAAGNTGYTTATVNVDLAAPIVMATQAPAKNSYGWNSTSVTATFAGSDALSGIAYCTPAAIMSNEGSSQTVTGYCRDYAGLSSTATLTMSIDRTAPLISAVRVPLANQYGWASQDVSVSYTCSDNLSGVRTCPPARLFSSEGLNISTSAMVYDYAGSTNQVTVNGISIDKTKPVSTAALSGTLVSGWYNTAVSIMLSSTDALSGVGRTNYRLERAGVLVSSGVYAAPVSASTDGLYTVYYYSADKAGNTEAEKSTAFKIDRTLPQVSYTLIPAANGNAWNNTAVQVIFSGTDTFSGVVQCSSQTVLAAGQAQAVAGWCRDAAGNISYSTATVNVDLTIPVVSASQTPAKNSYGWNNTSVTVTFTGTDALSTISYCEPAKIISNDGSSQTVSGYCRDYAGLSSTATLTLSIDKTAPLISAARTPVANAYGWTNQNVSVNYTCSDSLSGVRICPSVMSFSSEGLNVSTSGMVYDYAGNTNQVNVNGISIDKTKPVTTAGLTGIITNGWYSTAVSVTLVSTDALSGVNQTNYRLERGGVLVSSGVYATPVSASMDGSYIVYYYGTDKGGNVEAEKSTAFKVDRTLPQVSYTLIPAANGNAWNNTAVQVVFSGTDTLSGVVECSSQTVSVAGQAQAVAGWCRDTAGNTGYSTATVNVDLTRPVSIAAQNPAPNVKGWNNTNVGVTFSGSDILSGLLYCSPEKIIFTEGASQMASGYCMDYAGNSSTATLTLNIDKTSPVIVISSPAAGNYFVATKNKIIVSFAVTDNLDPAPKAAAMLRQLEDRGSPRGGRPAAIVILAGQQIEPLDIDDGIWRLTANATDFADNISSAAGGLFEVVHDVLPPRTALASGAGSYQGSGQALYVTGRTTFTLTSIDDLVAVADGVGLGVKKQDIGVNAAGGGLLRGLAFENTAPVQGAAFISTFKLDQEIDGAYNLAFNSEDVLSNVGKIKVSTFIVDNTPPQTVFTRVLGPAYLTYVSTWTLFELAPIDPGSFASGVKETVYGINSGAVATSPLRFNLPGTDGNYLVKYLSKDNVDNLEVEKSSQVFVDAAQPFSALAVIGGKQYPGAVAGSFYASLSSKFGFTAADPIVGGGASGVKIIESADNGGMYGVYSQPISLDEGRHTINYRATDRVENTEVARSTHIYVDNTAPVTSFNVSEPLYIKDGVRYITPVSAFMFSAIDPLTKEVAAGVERIETAVDGGQWIKYAQILKFAEGRHTIKYRAIDNVGNVEAERIIEVQSDNTAPISNWSAASGDRIERGNKFYLNALGRIALGSVDPVISDVASGVEGIYYGIDTVPTEKYTAPFGFAEGVRTIKFNAKDNVGNTEVVKSTVIYVDGTKPVTELSVSGDQYKNDRQYISRRTDIVIAAADPVVSDVSVDVKETKYAVDSGGYSDYSQFKLSVEGRRLVSFYSADHVSNVEAVKTAELWVDGTAPLSVLDVLGGKQYPGAEPGSFYASLATKFGFVSVDPLVSGGAAGLKVIEYADGSGAPIAYTQPILLGEGKHSITYRATDQVENTEVFRSTQIYIDNTAPVTSFTIAGPLYIKDGIRHITPESELTFTSADPLVSEVSAGVERIETAVDGEQWLKYTQALKFAEGRHTVKYRAIDNVGNIEAERVLEVRSDSTPPVTAQHIGAPYYVSGAGVNYITPETPLTFSANDPITSDVASGVERVETSVDGGAYALYTAALKFPEGRHTIKYRTYDNVGNLEAAQTLEVQSDASAPESRWLPASGPWIEKDNKFYLNALGSIALESADPVRNNVAAGLENIYYGTDAAPSVKYTAVFSLAEGVRTVNYSAKDNLGNTELVKSTVAYVDGTKPVTGLSLSGDQYNGDKQYISQRTDIVITAADPVVNNVAVGVKDTEYSVDGGAFVNYSLFKLSAEGRRLVSYYSTDFISNIETAKTTALWVDNTPPSTALSIAGARYTAPADEKLYITRDSGIVLTSSDPVSNDTASGVMLTKYRIDNGNWLVYSGSFTIAAEGLHTLEYYALDRVQNAKALSFAKIAVDNTPPATAISLGEPKSEVFGLPVLMQNTPITLTAADPVMNSVSAGLNSIFYELENVQTGVRSLVTAYTSPFTITEQGTFIIRYWSKDNTGNTETPKEKMAAVATWRADGLIAASGLDMSGTADISGSVKSNAIVSLGGNARILGDVTASTITLTGKAQITGLQISGATPVNPTPIYLAGIIESAAAVNNNALLAAYLVDGKLALSSKVNLILSTGTYYFKGMDLSGGSSITIAGKVDILVEGGITINGGSSLNASGEASRLAIVVSTASELKFNGGGALAACVYAPYSDLKLTGNALLGGHYFVRTAAVSGTGNLLQSGEALPVAAAPTGGGPKTKAAAMPGSRVGVLAGPDPEFRLGEVYVFPNPAKGTEAPIFHIETGLADSVKITIYTISGRAAHEHTLTGLPAELDDGNGLSYAYEYTWRGHIPSGIYLYYIEAQKAGQTLKKTGKFGVVR